ncbi:[Pyruvate dehydrogenase [lipoamide]] kinase, mitochondrial [Papilio xuthus]|uniref:[Pyruvate dehydrogenase [lipoamide]] kinase, mitochondrial n=1 Tax=Papilio xuthus TaxID=66420 RepID=A0A194Q434_PAPXU|nr:[Pyruvate dehydrogenase [lipoamide]] kinase, mitochondrial [Papilio xuthus]
MSDRGGGIPRSVSDLLFKYMYSTAPQPSKSDSHTVPLAVHELKRTGRIRVIWPHYISPECTLADLDHAYMEMHFQDCYADGTP